jgi:hypothetical protein
VTGTVRTVRMSAAMGDTMRDDYLAGIDVDRIRVEGAIVEVLRALDVVSERTAALGDERTHAVDQAAHAARVSMVEALRRCARADRPDI